MKVLTPGHKYELDSFEFRQSDKYKNNVQVIQFIEKRPTQNKGELITINDGTTNEEVLEMMIDRMMHLHAKFPCKESAIVITNLQESLMWLEKRTRDRKKRGVEGKHIA